jgi:cathepsin B
MAWQYLTQTGVVTGGNYGDYSWCASYPLPNCEHHVNATRYPNCASLNGGNEFNTPNCPTACDSNSTYRTPYGQDKHIFSSAYSVASNVTAIQSEIMMNGPVEAAFSVYADFEAYTGGVYQHLTGDFLGGHAVKILGWGTDSKSNLPYWLVANSWNTAWGEKGFFRILRGADECGIEDDIVAGLYSSQ